MFLLCFVSILTLQPTAYTNVSFFLIYSFLLTLYYFLYGKTHQRFSANEERRLLALHVVRNNQHRRQNKNHQRQRNQPLHRSKNTAQSPTSNNQQKRSRITDDSNITSPQGIGMSSSHEQIITPQEPRSNDDSGCIVENSWVDMNENLKEELASEVTSSQPLLRW